MAGRPRHDLVAIALVFAAARLAGWAAGVRFDLSHLGSAWQVMDVELLRTAPWRTVWFTHAQPPLFNLLIAGGLQTGDAMPWVMGGVFGTVTLGGILALYGLGRMVLHARWPALALALWFCVSPDVMLFSESLMYDSLVPWMLCIGIFGVAHGYARGGAGWMAAGFGMLAAVVLLRSMIHPAWLLLAAGVALALSGWRWRMLAAAAPGLAVVGAMLAKNLVLFGFLGLSSWGPLNLVGVTVERLPDAERAAMVEDGRLSRLSLLYSFPYIEELLPLLPPIPATGEPVLDAMNKANGLPNYNHMAMLVASRLRMPDALAALRADPGSYAMVLGQSLYHFERPANEFRDMLPNRRAIERWARFVNAAVGLQPAAWLDPAYDEEAPGLWWRRVSYGSVLVLVGFLGALGVGAARIAGPWRRDGSVPGGLLALALVLLTGAFVLVVSSALDTSENNRARYTVAPLLTLGAAWLAADLSRRRRSVTARGGR